jgi:DNA-binding transcriptional LysR family regulator
MRGSQFAELSSFVTVAEEKSFTKAAKSLGISVSTLSQSVRSLEERLNVRLLNRTTRNVAVTDAGERLLLRLKPVLEDYEAAVESVNAFRDRPCGALRLTVPPPVVEFLLVPILSKFLAEYPDIRVEISSDAALTNIVTERFDAGIRSGRKVERDMIAVKIFQPIEMALVASPAYLAKHGTPQTPQDLKDHNCIRFRLPSGIWPWQFEKKGKRIDVAVTGNTVVNDPYLAARLAVDGVGILFFAEPYVCAQLRGRKLVQILQEWMPPGDDLYLYYPSRRQTPVALEAFIAFLKKEGRAGRKQNASPA